MGIITITIHDLVGKMDDLLNMPSSAHTYACTGTGVMDLFEHIASHAYNSPGRTSKWTIRSYPLMSFNAFDIIDNNAKISIDS